MPATGWLFMCPVPCLGRLRVGCHLLLNENGVKRADLPGLLVTLIFDCLRLRVTMQLHVSVVYP